jgi:hypothetical protein
MTSPASWGNASGKWVNTSTNTLHVSTLMVISKYLVSLNEKKDIPNVRLAQQHSMSNQQTLATIATFFSAVTATAIQYAVGLGDTHTLSRIVLALWFSSLVFSIASALNSSIALIWRSAT